mgnify:CR=1 FL=1
MTYSLKDLAAQLQTGSQGARALVEDCLAAIDDPNGLEILYRNALKQSVENIVKMKTGVHLLLKSVKRTEKKHWQGVQLLHPTNLAILSLVKR